MLIAGGQPVKKLPGEGDQLIISKPEVLLNGLHHDVHNQLHGMGLMTAVLTGEQECGSVSYRCFHFRVKRCVNAAPDSTMPFAYMEMIFASTSWLMLV